MLVATDIQHAVIGAVELFTDIFLALTSVGDYCFPDGTCRIAWCVFGKWLIVKRLV